MAPLSPSADPQYLLRDLIRVPGLLSLARVPLVALFALVAHDPWWGFGQTSPMGAVVDGATDKIFVLGVVITLALTHRLTPWQAVVLGARDIGEALLAGAVLLRRDAPARHREQRADAFGKATTVMQFAAVLLALWRSPATPWAVVLTGALGVLTAAHYARRSL